MAGKRLDQVLAELFPDYSRSRLQQWLRAGHVEIDGEVRLRPRDAVQGGELVALHVPVETAGEWQAQELAFNIVYEDDDLIVIDKPVGLVVHPCPTTPDTTLVNALLHHEPRLIELPRAGVVHRLDKDTSGVLVVARSLAAHNRLVAALQERAFEREYRTVVNGVLISGGSVDAPIGRHPHNRTRMAVTAGGKPAVTHYRVLQRYRAHSLLQVKLETGRTHQIRVHMAHRGFPVTGDPVYGGRLKLPPQCSQDLAEVLRAFKRQALHAFSLGLEHPRTGEFMRWRSPLPADMVTLVTALEADAASTGV